MQRLAIVAFLSAACGVPATVHTPQILTADQKRIAAIVFPDQPHAAAECTKHESRSYVECLLRSRLASDSDALTLSMRLYDELGVVVGVDTEKVTDDGSYRGVVHSVPALPIGAERVHLVMVLDALRNIRDTLDELSAHAEQPIAFPRAPEALRFFRTIDRTTPSAYATAGEIAYNVSGELWTDAESVESTLVHELFHLVDERDDWSDTALTEIFDHIREKCGTDTACLEPYAPYDTRVDGDMFYAFHPKGDVREYGGELAIRFVRDQRDWMNHRPESATSFKCRRPENTAAWTAFAKKYFGSMDLVPPCGPFTVSRGTSP